MSVLDEIIATTRRDLEQRKRSVPLSELALGPRPARPSFRDALARRLRLDHVPTHHVAKPMSTSRRRLAGHAFIP